MFQPVLTENSQAVRMGASPLCAVHPECDTLLGKRIVIG